MTRDLVGQDKNEAKNKSLAQTIFALFGPLRIAIKGAQPGLADHCNSLGMIAVEDLILEVDAFVVFVDFSALDDVLAELNSKIASKSVFAIITGSGVHNRIGLRTY